MQQADQLKSRLKTDFHQVQESAVVKPKVDLSGIDAMTAHLDKLKADLTGMKGKQLTLVDPAAIQVSQVAIAGIEAEIQRSTQTLNAMKASAHEAGGALEQGAHQGEQAHSKLDKIVHGLKEHLGEIKGAALGAFGASALAGGISGLVGGIEKLIDKGKENLEIHERMELAFEGNKEQAEAAEKAMSKLSSKYAISSLHLRELSATARTMGGVTGEANTNIVELAAGLEKMHLPGVDANGVLRSFLAGAGDPEGAAGLGRLSKAFPELASGLKGIKDPAEKTKKALEIMGPAFEILQEQADGPLGKMDKFKNTVSSFQREVGEKLVMVLATWLIPTLDKTAVVLKFVGGVFKDMPAPIKTIATILAVLSGALIAYNVVTAFSIVKTIQHGVAQGWLTITKMAGTVATWAQVAATWALSAALTVLTSPIGLIVIGIVALVAGLAYAWTHSEKFRNALTGIWNAIKPVVEFMFKWLTPIGLLIQALKYLYEHVGFVHTGIDKLISTVKNVANTLSEAGTAVLEFLGVTKHQTEEEKKNAEAKKRQTEATVEHMKALQKVNEEIEKSIALYKQETEEIGKSLEKSQDLYTLNLKKMRDDVPNAIAAIRKYLAQDNLTADQRREGEENLRISLERQKEYASVQTFIAKEGATTFVEQKNRERDAIIAKEAMEKETAAQFKERYLAQVDLMEKTGKGFTYDKAIEDLTKRQANLATVTREEKALYNDYTTALIDLRKKKQDAERALLSGSTSELDKRLKELANKTEDDKKNLALKAKALGVKPEDTKTAISNIEIEAEREKQKIILEIRAKAGLTGALQLELQTAEVKKKYVEQNKAVAELLNADVKNGKITREEADAAILNHAKAQNNELMQVSHEFYEKQRVEKDNAAKKELEATTKGADALPAIARFAVLESAQRNYQNNRMIALEQEAEQERDYIQENIKDKAAQSTALITLEFNLVQARKVIAQEGIEADKKVSLEKIEANKQAALAELEYLASTNQIKKDSLDFALLQMDIEYDAQRQALRKKYQNEAEYQLALKQLNAKEANERLEKEKEHVRQHNLLYAAATTVMKVAFDQAANAIKSSLGKMFGYEKDEADKMSENDKKLAQLDKDDKIKSLQEQVRENKISYEKYLAEKQKAEDDYNKKINGDKKDQLTFLQSIEKALTDGLVAELQKRGEAYLADQILKLFTEETKQAAEVTTGVVAQGSALAQVAAHSEAAAGDLASAVVVEGAETTKKASFLSTAWAAISSAASTIYSWFASIPFGLGIPLAAAIVVGIVAAISGLTSKSDKPKGAAKGLLHDPLRDGKDGQLIAIGETGLKEFAAPEETAKDYFVNDLGPQIYKGIMQNQMRAAYATGNIVPPVAPTLSPAFKSSHDSHLDMAAIKEFNLLLKEVSKNGIVADVTGKIDARLDPRETERAVRMREREVNRRAGVKGGGM